VTTFTTRVRIARPTDEVFALVGDPLRFPLWNSAVQAVRLASGDPGEVGSTYVMERDLPSGRAENQVEVFARLPPTEFAIRTLSGPTPFVYRYRLSAEPEATLLALDAEVKLPGPAALLGPVAARGVKRGVDANLAALRAILE
jgi:Polyketide cyclase / dehydrase and lipid transport